MSSSDSEESDDQSFAGKWSPVNKPEEPVKKKRVLPIQTEAEYAKWKSERISARLKARKEKREATNNAPPAAPTAPARPLSPPLVLNTTSRAKSAPSTPTATLPPPLDTALLADVELEFSNDETGNPKKDAGGRDIKKASKVMGVDLNKLEVTLIRMLCSRWNVKRYRQCTKVRCLELIAHHQQLGAYYRDAAKEVKMSRDEIIGSKMRLTNVIFSEDFFPEVCAMNDTKKRSALDAGKTGRNQRLWSQISDSYNDLMNDSKYGSFAFVKNKHIESFASTYDLKTYEKLSWVKAGAWFKEMIKEYDRFMVKYTTSGQAQPDFHGYVEGKDHVFYYRLFIEERPDTHKSLTTVLHDDIFNELTIMKKTKVTSVRSNSTKKAMKARQAVMQTVADSMTDRILHSRSHEVKRTEKLQVEREIGQIHMNLVQLSNDPSADAAQNHFKAQLLSHMHRISVLEKFFQENASPSKKVN